MRAGLLASSLSRRRGIEVLNSCHPFFPTFVRLMSEAAAKPPVYDLGTNRRFAKEVGLVRYLFNGVDYVAGGFRYDASLGDNACDFHCDLHDLSTIESRIVGSVICLEVLEHLTAPTKAISEIHRILKPDGICVMAVPFLASYHGKSRRNENPVYNASSGFVDDGSHSGYGDYWRFTHEGLALAFAEAGFRRVDVWPIDGWLLSRLCLLGLYPLLSKFSWLLKVAGWLDQPRLGRATTLHFVRATK